MKNTQFKRGLLMGLAGAVMCFSAPAMAQQSAPPTDDAATGVPNTSDEIVVTGEIVYRNRTEETAPVLEYGLDYFQRFEPLSAGDALKRVPSVAFLSDVIESDGVRLRGLDPAYTQILINGEQVPGSGSSSGAFGNGAEQSFFVDRIPAELIERIEIVRSASANRSGDAVAGAINIVLRDALSLDGGYVRVGTQRFDDGQWVETFGGVYGGQVGPGRLLLGANVQDRYNPKRKFSQRFDGPGGTLENIEIQTDDRSGTDYSFNLNYALEIGSADLEFGGYYVKTERNEDEDSIEYRSGLVNAANLLTNNDNNVDIDQQSFALNTKLSFAALGGRTSFKLDYAQYENDELELEDEIDYLRDAVIFPEADRYTGDRASVNLMDREYKAKVEHERNVGFGDLEVGLHFEQKTRDNGVFERPRVRVNLPAGTQSPNARPTITLPAFTGFVPVPGGDNTIERTRFDPYVQLSGKAGAISWETGLRLETTEVDVEDRTVAGGVSSTDYQIALPSAHLRWDLTEENRITASVARTVRNPSFSFLSPATLEAELGDNDFLGNPKLEPESAWGLDLGFERRLGRTGIAGVNFFYRDVTDVIEVFSTGAVGSEGAGTFVYSARNTGDGQVYGVEFDLSTPLTAISLENTGVFFNYSWLDSKIDDEFGERTFNSQSEYVLNVGFIHDFPQLAAAFGATYRKQGDAFSRVVGEEVVTSYGADLEVFLEKRIAERFTVRLVGSNLLNASKDEVFNKFDTVADQRSRSFAEFELESEEAGPVYQLIGRLAF